MKIGHCYWRFRGNKEFVYGYATPLNNGLWRMGRFNGDTVFGPIVDPTEIEVRPYN